MKDSKYILDLLKKIPSMVEDKKLIMFFIDGLGINNMRLPFLKKDVYRTVFPSSTPTFFYTIHSLLRPEEHGFLEWNMRFHNNIITIPPWVDINGRVVNASKEEMFPFTSLSEILHRKGYTSVYYSPYADSPFSMATGIKATNVKIASPLDIPT